MAEFHVIAINNKQSTSIQYFVKENSKVRSKPSLFQFSTNQFAHSRNRPNANALFVHLKSKSTKQKIFHNRSILMLNTSFDIPSSEHHFSKLTKYLSYVRRDIPALHIRRSGKNCY